ncbi:MAG: hypothetical protein JWQ71_1243 [Pedosphaera sp.]|nr:hypothetical protein [Pedosphaera sp.]
MEIDTIKKEIELLKSELAADREKLLMLKAQRGLRPIEAINTQEAGILSGGQLANKQAAASQLWRRLGGSETFLRDRRAKLAYWQRFKGNPGSEKAALFQQFETDGALLHTISTMAEFDDEAVLELVRNAQFLMTDLIQLANAGNAKATQEIAKLAIEIIEAVNQIGAQHPRQIKPLAERLLEWPLLAVCRKLRCLQKEAF